MPIEQRVIGSPKIGAKNPSGGIGAGKPAAAPEEPKKTKKKLSKKLLIIVVVGVLVVGGGAAYMLGLFGGGSATSGAPAPTPKPVPGAVLAVEAVSVNLADGHYLRIGLGLQLTAAVGKETPTPDKAVDLVITLFSGHTVAEVNDPATRAAMKAELLTELTAAYEGKVMDVYLTNFVTQ